MMKPFWAAKVKLPLAHALSGTKTLTASEVPGRRLPLAGWKVTPPRLLVAVQVRLACEVAVSPSRSKHPQPVPLATKQFPTFPCNGAKLAGVTVRKAPEQLHGTVTPPPPPLAEKVNEMGVAGWGEQARLGTVMLTLVDPPAGMTPCEGAKVTPLRLLLVTQEKLTRLLEATDKVALHVQP